MSLASVLTRGLARQVSRWPFHKASERGRRLGRLIYRLDARHRQVALRNLQHAFPDCAPEWHQRIARASFEQAGRTALEMLWSSRLQESGFEPFVEPVGLEHLRAALEAGKGALIAAAHFGNWELMGVVFPLLDVPLVSIARPLDDADLDSVLNRLRTATGAGILPKANALRGALGALREGKLVVILNDQNTLRKEAVFVPYFGKPAATTPVIAHLHLRSGAPVLPAFALPSSRGYKLLIEPPLKLPAMDRERAIVEITAAITARIEHHVRAAPEAWLWMHDRWRERPPEDTGG